MLHLQKNTADEWLGDNYCGNLISGLVQAYYYVHGLTVSLSLFLLAILEMDSPTLFTSLMKPAPLTADVSLALGSCE